MSSPNEVPPLLQPSTPLDRTPVEYDEGDFHRAITMYSHRLYGTSLPPPSAPLFLGKAMQDGLLLHPNGGGFVRKKPLLPLWVEFVTSVWQPMSKGPKVEPLDFSNPTITSSRAADFLRWLAPRRTYNVDEAGQPADGTRWWPHDVGGVIAAVGDEHRTKLQVDQEEESSRRRAEDQLPGMPPLGRARVLEWYKGVEMVEWDEAMLMGLVSREYEARAPLAEVLRRPASDFDVVQCGQGQQQRQQERVVEDLRLGAEASNADGQRVAAPPLTLGAGGGESSIPAPTGGANERRVSSQQHSFGSMVLEAMAQSGRQAIARERRGAIAPEEARQHQPR